MKHRFGKAKTISTTNRFATFIAIILASSYILYSQDITSRTVVFIGTLILIGLTLNELGAYILVDSEQHAVFRVRSFMGLELSIDKIMDFQNIELLYLNQSAVMQSYTSLKSQRTVTSRRTQYSVYLKSKEGSKHQLFTNWNKDKIKQESVELSELLNIKLNDNT
jgi:hypothetical protein